MIVTITSNASIDNLSKLWNIETLMNSYEPLQFRQIDQFTIQLFFSLRLWNGLQLSDYYDGNYLGTNLLSYLETSDSSFGIELVDDDQAFIVVFPIIAIGISALILALAANGDTCSNPGMTYVG